MPIPSKISSEKPMTAKERVCTTLKEWIIDGVLLPDEKIFDKDIAKYFSMSRTPVREAFQLLADQKLIIISPGKESRVAPVDMKLTYQSYEILADLEALAMKYAFPALDVGHIGQMKSLNVKMDAAVTAGDFKAAGKLDNEFHQIILDAADNDFLNKFCATLKLHVARVETKYFSSRENFDGSEHTSFKEHNAVIQAIENKDLHAACDAIRANWLNTIDGFDLSDKS